MVDVIEKEVVEPSTKTVAIAHCNNYERAIAVKDNILSRIKFKNAIITETAGISSLYANDGGIIVSY